VPSVYALPEASCEAYAAMLARLGAPRGVLTQPAPYGTDPAALLDALVAANPDRLVWGSDWPYVRMGDPTPDVGHLLDLLRDRAGDAGLVRRVLVDNPAALYGFTDNGRSEEERRC
jgi:predicted TIM-barrel fold metal-dependent hydrolase